MNSVSLRERSGVRARHIQAARATFRGGLTSSPPSADLVRAEVVSDGYAPFQ